MLARAAANYIVPVILVLSYAGTQEKDSRESNIASKESDKLGKSLRNINYVTCQLNFSRL